jgi:hypothetical protein
VLCKFGVLISMCFGIRVVCIEKKNKGKKIGTLLVPISLNVVKTIVTKIFPKKLSQKLEIISRAMTNIKEEYLSEIILKW